VAKDVRAYASVRKPSATDSVAETALRNLMRNLDGSVGISILEATLTENIQACMPSLSSKLRPDKPLSQALQLKAPLSMTDPAGTAALRRSDPAGFDSRLSQRLCPDDDNGARVLHGAGTPAAPPRNQARDPRRRRKHPAQRTRLGRILVHSDHAEGYRPAFNADWWLISSDACLVIKVRRGYPAEWLLRGNFTRSRRLG